MQIDLFAAREDNFGVLIRDEATGKVACIDAPDEGAIRARLEALGWGLDLILITHRHYDHVEAAAPLAKAYGAKIVAPEGARSDVPYAHRFVTEGGLVEVGGLTAEVWFTPGHCADHICYHFADEQVIFAGDTCFTMGCGRVFDSTPEKLYAALLRIAALPDATRLYSGHEYTLANAKFCAHVEPDNAAIAARLAEVSEKRARGEFTVPTTIGEEKATNVFMRAKDAVEFAARREAKNTFKG